MSTRPLRALTRATDRSFGGTIDIKSKSLLPSLCGRILAPLEAT